MNRSPSLPTIEEGVQSFPRAYAKSRRFSVGIPRNLTIIEPPPVDGDADADGNGRTNGAGDAEPAPTTVLFCRSRDGDDPTLCLWRLDPATGSEQVVVDPRRLSETDGDELPAAERARRERARESAGGIVAYSTDRAGTKACFSLAGLLFLVDLSTDETAALQVTGPVFDPRLSPDGRSIAYVSGNSLRLVDVSGPDEPDPTPGGAPPSLLSTDRNLASGSSPLVGYGRAEFIAAEEMQRSRGFWWGPDGDQLLVTRVDESPVPQWWIADPAHPEREPNEVRYPAAGSVNARVDLLVIGVDGAQDEIDWDDNGRFEYLADVIWNAGQPPLVVRQTRDQREVSIAALDLATLDLQERRRITDDVWVELIPGSPTMCEAGLLTIEDLLEAKSVTEMYHPGRRALLLNGQPVSGAEINVRSIVGTAGRHVLVTAWTVPTEIHLFAVDLDNPRRTVRLTANPGVHNAVLGGRRTVDDEIRHLVAVTTARPAADGTELAIRPFVIDDAEARLGTPIAFVDDISNRPPIKAAPSFVQLGADRLESALFVPANFDGEHPLPVLLDPYGGPHAQRVLKNQAGHLVSQWFAEQGFVVLVTDGRGTPGRGPTWERQVWGDLATPILEDQLAALDDAADQFGFLDLDRVAIRGWSFGGYLAALAVLRHPDRFHAAVAGAPVTSWRLYDTHYTERYLGHPDDYPQHYEATDLMKEAANLSQPLLLIHGLADDNVVAAHTLQFSSALLAAAAPHQVLPLSGVTHMTPQEAVAENLLWLQLRFLRDALGVDGRARPADDGRQRPPARPPAVHPKTAPVPRRQT